MSPGDKFDALGIRFRLQLRPHPFQMEGDGEVPWVSALAAIDTGADITMIRRSVANEIGLRPLGTIEVHHFSGPALLQQYVAMLACPLCGESRAIELVDDGGAKHSPSIEFPELLLGRDILRYTQLSLDGPSGAVTFSIDFGSWPEAGRSIV